MTGLMPIFSLSFTKMHYRHTILSQLGVQLSQRPSKFRVLLSFLRVKKALLGRSIAALGNLPVMTEPTIQASLSIMSILRSATYLVNSNLYALSVLKELALTLEHGNTTLSAGTYCAYGMILSSVIGDLQGGYEFGELALGLLDTQAKRVHAGVQYVVHGMLRPLKHHLNQSLEPLHQGYYQAIEDGNTEYATWLILAYLRNSLSVGRNIDENARQHALYAESLKSLKQQTALQHLSVSQQLALNLLGAVDNPAYLDGPAFNHDRDVALLVEANDMTGLGYTYLAELMLAYWFDDLDRAMATIPYCEKYLSGFAVLPEVQQYWWFAGLVRLAAYAQAADQKSLLKQIDLSCQKLRKWAQYAPMNNQHRLQLLEAERHRAHGNRLGMRI